MSKKERKPVPSETVESSIFDIDRCRDLVSIEEKLLKLTAAEKKILEDYKNSDCILQTQEFWKLHNSIVASFNHCRTLLNIRRDLILGQEQNREETEKLLTETRENKRKAIADRFLLRKLRYENWLYKRECAIRYQIDRANLKKAHKAVTAPLKALLAEQNTRRPP